MLRKSNTLSSHRQIILKILTYFLVELRFGRYMLMTANLPRKFAMLFNNPSLFSNNPALIFNNLPLSFLDKVLRHDNTPK